MQRICMIEAFEKISSTNQGLLERFSSFSWFSTIINLVQNGKKWGETIGYSQKNNYNMYVFRFQLEFFKNQIVHHCYTSLLVCKF